jgi:hypothetical protein
VLCNIASQWQLKVKLMAELVTAVLRECARGRPCDNHTATHRGRVPSYFDWQEVEEGNGQLSHFFKNMTVFFMWMP